MADVLTILGEHLSGGHLPALSQLVVDAVDQARQAAGVFVWRGRLHDATSHYATFAEDGWVIEHSLDCRVRGMWLCDIDLAMREGGVPDGKLGRFSVQVAKPGVLEFTPVHEEVPE